MQEFVQHLIDRTGISPDQANNVIHAIREFVNQKAPMMTGAVDKILGAEHQESGESTPAEGGGSSMFGGIENKLEEGLGGLTGKLGGFFGN